MRLIGKTLATSSCPTASTQFSCSKNGSLAPKAAPLACNVAHLQATVTKAFSQRRKVIKNCVAGRFTEAQLIAAGINPQLRPEAIGMEHYVALAEQMIEP